MDSFGRFHSDYAENPDEYKKNKPSWDLNTATWFVTEESPRVENPPKFKYNLTAPQRASLHTMIQIETYKSWTTNNGTMYTQAAVLSNALGSGKTAIILGLLSISTMPTRGPKYSVGIPMKSTGTGKHGNGNRGVILRNYGRVMRPAVIFVGQSVVDQWEGEIKKFNPDLKYVKIDDIRSLRQFYDHVLYTKQLDELDIILVKNKDITGQWTWKHDEQIGDEVDSGTKKIYNVFGTIVRKFCFTRLIVDDFDTIGLPGVATHINALMTWYVSCTRKKSSVRIWHNVHHPTIESIAFNSCLSYADILSNETLYHAFNVCVYPRFHEKYMMVGRPNYWYYLFKNTTQKVANLINLMAGDKVSEIMEALNGDAHEQAAKIAGIETNSVTDIFKSLLNKNYDSMIESRRILASITDYYETVSLETLDDPDEKDTFTVKDLRAGRRVNYKYKNYKGLVRDERERCELVYKETVGCLKKFRDSISSNECQVCCLPLAESEENYCVLPCCFEIIHSDCAVRGCQFRSEIQPGTGGQNAIVGYCPFNKAHRVLFTQLCYISKGIDLNTINEDNLKHEAKSVKTVSEKKEIVERTKFDALWDIIMCHKIPEQKSINLHIHALLEGSKSLGPAPSHTVWARVVGVMPNYSPTVKRRVLTWISADAVPRVMAFANFDESLDKLQNWMQERGLKYERLMGSSHNITEQVRRFASGETQILLINSTRHCSGLNLQFATDLVFMHQIKNTHLQSQVAGRIQREGRTSDANIHFLLYDNELEELEHLKRA